MGWWVYPKGSFEADSPVNVPGRRASCACPVQYTSISLHNHCILLLEIFPSPLLFLARPGCHCYFCGIGTEMFYCFGNWKRLPATLKVTPCFFCMWKAQRGDRTRLFLLKPALSRMDGRRNPVWLVSRIGWQNMSNDGAVLLQSGIRQTTIYPTAQKTLVLEKYTCWPFLICSISGQFNGSYSAASKQINGTALQCFQNRDVRITLLARSERLAICFHQWCAAATSSVQVGIKATFLCCFVPRIKYAEMYCHWIWRFDLESIT